MYVHPRWVATGVIAALAGVGAPVRAQSPASPEVVVSPALPLDDAVRTAVGRHPDLSAAEAIAAAARARPALERQLMPPMLEVQAWQWPLRPVEPSLRSVDG